MKIHHQLSDHRSRESPTSVTRQPHEKYFFALKHHDSRSRLSPTINQVSILLFSPSSFFSFRFFILHYIITQQRSPSRVRAKTPEGWMDLLGIRNPEDSPQLSRSLDGLFSNAEIRLFRGQESRLEIVSSHLGHQVCDRQL